jgi:outer membrane protein assembly factor BamB
MADLLIRTFVMCCAPLLAANLATAQSERGDWSMTGADAGQSGWQKSESILSPDSVPAHVKFLWKISLGKRSQGAASFSEPLLAGRLINAQGFKDMVYWASDDTIYAVDSELGVLLWKKQFKSEAPARAAGCGTTRLGILMEPPPVINFNARRRRPPGTPPPPEPAPLKPSERRLGVPPGGGFFGLKGIYILARDGMLHEQVITTGADYAPPVRFLPAANSDASSLNYMNHVVYSSTGHGCAGVPSGLWSIDLASPDYSVANIQSLAPPLALSGPAIAPDGDALFVTGTGSGEYPGSVISLAKDMKTLNWYTPSGGMGSYRGVSLIAFDYKGKDLAVAPAKDGSVALLDAETPGGADHQTALFETPALAKPGERHGWDGFAEYEDKEGNTWVFASISSTITLNEGDAKRSGSTPHGGIVAFKLKDDGGQLALDPVWVSPDMVNPAPPRVANGIVIALAGGDASTRATLWMLNAATGAVLYSSKNEIPTYTALSGVAIGDGHAFFTDHDNVLYSFGIGMEH